MKSLLSAAGGANFSNAAREAGLASVPLLGFDMGGTSTDVFHFDPARGELAWERSTGSEVAGLPLRSGNTTSTSRVTDLPKTIAVQRFSRTVMV